MKGRDRNKPCFCGSGKKWKKCHYVEEWEQKNADAYVASMARLVMPKKPNDPQKLFA